MILSFVVANTVASESRLAVKVFFLSMRLRLIGSLTLLSQ